MRPDREDLLISALWFAFDVWGAAQGGVGVAYAAHLGGFAAGFGLATLLLFTQLRPLGRGERSLYDALQGRTR